MSQGSTALEPGVQLQSGFECRVKHLSGWFDASCGPPAARLLDGTSPPHIPGLLPAMMRRLQADPAPASGAQCFVMKSPASLSILILNDVQSGCAPPKDAGPHVAMPLCVLLQAMSTECWESDEAGEVVISRRGIAAALQVGSVWRQCAV